MRMVVPLILYFIFLSSGSVIGSALFKDAGIITKGNIWNVNTEKEYHEEK